MAAQKLYRFTVEGRADSGFPLDMLRFDQCWPRTQDSADKVFGQFASNRAGWERHIVSIMLSGICEPSVERWASFGWRVRS